LVLGATSTGSLAALSVQLSSKNRSFWDLVGPILGIGASLVGFLATRKWSVWSQSHSSQTSAIDSAATLPSNERLLKAISSLEAKVHALYTQYAEDEKEPVIIDTNPSPEDRLEQLQEKITVLKNSFGAKVDKLQEKITSLSQRLVAPQPTQQQASSPNVVLSQLSLIQGQLSQLNVSSPDSSTPSTPENSPLRSPSTHAKTPQHSNPVRQNLFSPREDEEQ